MTAPRTPGDAAGAPWAELLGDPPAQREIDAIWTSLALKGRMLEGAAWPLLCVVVRRILAEQSDATVFQRRRKRLGAWLLDHSIPVRTVVLRAAPQEETTQ